jgi:peptidoglycan/xylan/chitin deacetylase (PgdA/CDA1 family)
MKRSTVRRWIADVGYHTGATQALIRAGDRWRVLRGPGTFSVGPQRRDPFLVLIYHRVNRDTGLFAIERSTPETFRGHMTHIARHFHVMPLAEIVRRLASDEVLPPRSIAITFDDGYEDNYTDAYPILRELGLPATVFLTTGVIGTGGGLWFDRILHAFEHARRDRMTLPGEKDATDLREPPARAAAAFRTLQALMRLPDATRLTTVDRIVNELDPARAGRLPAMLDWDQVRTMASGGLSFGAHTVTHPILTRLPLEEAERELKASKQRIEQETGRPTVLMAYPVGRRPDYSPELTALAARLDFQAAFTTEPGANARGDDRFLLRRVKPLGNDVPTFALGLAGHYLTEWKAGSR